MSQALFCHSGKTQGHLKFWLLLQNAEVRQPSLIEDRLRAAKQGQAEIAKLRLAEQHQALEKVALLCTPKKFVDPHGSVAYSLQ